MPLQPPARSSRPRARQTTTSTLPIPSETSRIRRSRHRCRRINPGGRAVAAATGDPTLDAPRRPEHRSIALRAVGGGRWRVCPPQAARGRGVCGAHGDGPAHQVLPRGTPGPPGRPERGGYGGPNLAPHKISCESPGAIRHFRVHFVAGVSAAGGVESWAQRGKPSRRSPMMLRWIWSVPPAMPKRFAKSAWKAQRPPSGASGSSPQIW